MLPYDFVADNNYLLIFIAADKGYRCVKDSVGSWRKPRRQRQQNVNK